MEAERNRLLKLLAIALVGAGFGLFVVEVLPSFLMNSVSRSIAGVDAPVMELPLIAKLLFVGIFAAPALKVLIPAYFSYVGAKRGSVPLCPVCNSTMVKRVAKRGQHAGSTFWGCRKFPACRGILS